MKKIIVCILGFVCISLAGCVLEDIEERGDICPPGKLKNSRDGRHVVFSNMDCYEDYILLSPDMSDFAGTCGECSELEDESGQWKCNGVLTSCFDSGYESLKQNYAHCEHYRAHGVLAEGSNVNLGISFVRDYFDADAPVKPSELSNSCPKEFEVCKYDPKFVDESDENGIPGGYGCYQSCTDNLRYCGEGKLRHCVDPASDSEYCGAQGGCSSSDPESPNWVGMACENGMICQGGKCVCGDGYKVCEQAVGCVDILHHSEHCGETCKVCDSGYVCMNGSCVPYECDEPGLCSNDRHQCKNTDEACGESCIDCLMLPNVDVAACDDGGMCVIRTCKENFHPEFNEMTQTYECRKNTIEKCAPRDMDENVEVQNCTEIERSTEVACSAEGKCIVKGCADGFSVSSGQTQCVEQSCGSCDDESEICFMGTCQCKPGWVSCGTDGGNCKDIINDSDNCGGCGNECGDLSKPEHAIETGCYHAKCGVTVCESHYHPNEMECELNSAENCGAHGKNCMEIAHVVEAACNEELGTCVITSCEPKSHIYEEKEICEEDTAEHCGVHAHSCWIEHAVDVDCLWNEEEQFAYCVTKECEDGYHLTDDLENPDGPQICEKDDEDNCGEHGKKCQDNAHCVKKEEGYICECDSAFTDCGGVCINDFDTNREHCGGCGVICKDDLVCEGGKCICLFKDCGGSCIDTSSNKLHCGDCNKPCDDDKTCESGSCVCGIGMTQCNGTCVDTSSNDTYCGNCSTQCATDRTCSGGVCVCKSGLTDCGGICVDTNSNSAHCGACSNGCASDRTCSGGECVCKGGLTDCGGICVDTNSNSAHCGVCNNGCASDRTCSGGKCVCKTGLTDCGGICVDTNSNSAHCGACNKGCTSDRMCSGGQCVCNTGLTDCGGSCVNTSTNNAHCGACNNGCASDRTCSAGQCVCKSGLTDCKGSCVNTSTNNSHCGSCNNGCASDRTCSGGKCVCNSGLTDCSGTCVASFTNNNSHCGQCNNKCESGMTCQGTSCACPSGTLYCGRNCVGANIKATPDDTNEYINIRTSTDTHSTTNIVGTYSVGAIFSVYGYYTTSDGYKFYKVPYNGGVYLVNADYVALCEGFGKVTTKNDPLNVWDSRYKNKSYKQIPKGTENVCVHSESNGWYYVTYGKSGWVDGQYLTITTPIGSSPTNAAKCD